MLGPIHVQRRSVSVMNNAADRKSIRQAEKLAKVAETNNAEVVTGLMSTMNGRAWILAKLEACHIFVNPFGGDPLLTAYACGEMNVGQIILNDIMSYCPKSYLLMMEEANARRTATELARSQGTRRDSDESSHEPTFGPEFESGHDNYN